MSWEISNLSQNLWNKYGFIANPFDISPLSNDRNSLLSVSEAIVGRGFDTKESKLITNILRNPGGGRVLVSGNIGVGKTTFVNYHRYIWENHTQDRLFTTHKEISVSEKWGLRDFLISIICTIMDKLVRIKTEKELTKVSLFKELLVLSKIFYYTNFSVQGNVLGFGGGFSKSEQMNVPIVPEVQLIQYLNEVVVEIKKMGYSGIFLHIDNLELFSSNKPQVAKNFFEEIRDSIQTPSIYFVFVAKKGFFQEIISPLERVRSIFFGRPVIIPPLSKKQVLDAIHKRYQILAIKGKKITYPIEDEFIGYLYDLYSGKLRYIMDAMNMILPEFEHDKLKTISFQQAKKCLASLVKEHIQSNLTSVEWRVFLFCVEENFFTNSMLQEKFDMPSSNVARVIKRFLDLNLAYLKKREGRSLLYKANEYTKVINDRPVGNTKLKEKSLYSSAMTPRLERAIRLLENRDEISNKDYATLLSVSSATATRDLKKLMDLGILFAIGKGRSRYYKIIDS